MSEPDKKIGILTKIFGAAGAATGIATSVFAFAPLLIKAAPEQGDAVILISGASALLGLFTGAAIGGGIGRAADKKLSGMGNNGPA